MLKERGKFFLNISKDLISDLATTKGISLDYNEINQLANNFGKASIGLDFWKFY
jgi:hypothetical protein